MSNKKPEGEISCSCEPIFEEKYPDGGWGWVIVAATGISNFINIPVMQSFALLFGRKMIQLNLSTTDLTTIINVNAAFGMSLGLITGPILKKLGYRKVALFGGFSSFIGITATSWATTFIHFLITYSIITSVGTFMLMSAFSLAINTYFRERRGHASGMSTTLTGLGPVVMPQIITLLLYHYDTTGTTMILGALSLHSVLAALLLQPVEWHMKTVRVPCVEHREDEVECEEKNSVAPGNGGLRRRSRHNTYNSLENENDFDTYSQYGGIETPLVVHKFGSTQQIHARKKSTISYHRSISQSDDADTLVTRYNNISEKLNENRKSEETVNLGSSVKIFDEKRYHQVPFGDEENDTYACIKDDPKVGSLDDSQNNILRSNDDTNSEDSDEQKSKTQTCLRYIVNLFDLDLLRDPGYVILMLGMSLAVCAELNFSLFTPLILGDYDFTIQQIATVMSIIAFVDIVFRFLAPFIGDKLNFSAQTMYLCSLVLLIITRTSLMIFHDYTSALVVACGLGVAKGFRTVYMGLVIPSYVPLHRLPSASGIQSAVNCLCIVMSIPLMAMVRDKTGSFNWCIGALNCITFLTVSMWTVQLLVKAFKARNKESDNENDV